MMWKKDEWKWNPIFEKSIENFIEIHLLIYTMTLFEKSNCGNYPKW